MSRVTGRSAGVQPGLSLAGNKPDDRRDAYTLGVSMAAIGVPELLIALVLVLLLFGGSQLPKLARSLGQAKSELKKAADEDADPKGDQTSS